MLQIDDVLSFDIAQGTACGTLNGQPLAVRFAVLAAEVLRVTLGAKEYLLRPDQYAVRGLREVTREGVRTRRYALGIIQAVAPLRTDMLHLAVLAAHGQQRVVATLNGRRLPEVAQLRIGRQRVELEPLHPLLPILGLAPHQILACGATRRQRHGITSTQYCLRLVAGAVDPSLWELELSHAETIRQLVDPVGFPRPRPASIWQRTDADQIWVRPPSPANRGASRPRQWQ